jgi:hypothetical protein
MGLFDVIYCPNIDCLHVEPLEKGKEENCPECGTKGQPFGTTEAAKLIMSKMLRPQIKQKLEQGHL